MKAILVIDVKNIDQVKWCRVTVGEDNAQYMIDDVKPKPMPHKREAIGMLNDYARGKILGFNSCLKIILGEENE